MLRVVQHALPPIFDRSGDCTFLAREGQPSHILVVPVNIWCMRASIFLKPSSPFQTLQPFSNHFEPSNLLQTFQSFSNPPTFYKPSDLFQTLQYSSNPPTFSCKRWTKLQKAVDQQLIKETMIMWERVDLFDAGQPQNWATPLGPALQEEQTSAITAFREPRTNKAYLPAFPSKEIVSKTRTILKMIGWLGVLGQWD